MLKSTHVRPGELKHTTSNNYTPFCLSVDKDRDIIGDTRLNARISTIVRHGFLLNSNINGARAERRLQ